MSAKHAPTIETIQERIRGRGLRSTPGRVAVLNLLSKANHPLTHGFLAETMAASGFDQATVYRNLIDLTEAGILARIEVGDHVWRFELRPENEPDDARHAHFVCLGCGDVTCLPNLDVKLPRGAKHAKGGSVGTVQEVLLKGHCPRCG